MSTALDKNRDVFYVYEHMRATDGKVFYVGKGCGGRDKETHNRNRYWKNVAAKHGYTSRRVVERVDEELSFLVEVERIAQLKQMGFSLCNLTSGGEGTSGYVMPESAKAKISSANKGKKPTAAVIEKYRAAKLGKKASDETKRKMTAAASKRVQSDATRKKVSVAHLGRKHVGQALLNIQASARRVAEKNKGRPVPLDVRKKISDRLSGKPLSAKRIENIKAAIEKSKRLCPHCGKNVSSSAYARWHGNNCKTKSEVIACG